MKVRFIAEFDWKPANDKRNYVIVFKPNGGDDGRGLYTVKRECGQIAIALGKARAVAEEPQQDAPPATPAESE
jgi:hypothetical protein